mgnify:CR=1 FL=1
MRCLGFDLGSKTLGVSVSDTTNTIASSLKTIFFEEDNYESLLIPVSELIKEYNANKIILGLPKNMNNTYGKRAEISIAFKEMLEKEFNIEVILEDERLTTVISNNILISADVSRKKRKKKVDALAAQVILQNYLDRKVK